MPHGADHRAHGAPDVVAARAGSFGAAAADYDASRPGYPAAAATFVLGSAPRQVLDLAAGTGKLTRLLVTLGHQVVAVDPSAEMLAMLRARLGQVPTERGSAEAIPLPDGAVDAVVVGQGYHWFDPPRALPEIARVLRPGGVLGLLWNVRDESVGWVAEFGELVGANEDGTAGSADDLVAPALAPQFTGATVDLTRHSWPVGGPDGLVALAASRSYVIIQPPAQRTALLEKVRRLAASLGPGLAMPYICQSWRAVRAG